jgi:hypothetical protein
LNLPLESLLQKGNVQSSVAFCYLRTVSCDVRANMTPTSCTKLRSTPCCFQASTHLLCPLFSHLTPSQLYLSRLARPAASIASVGRRQRRAAPLVPLPMPPMVPGTAGGRPAPSGAPDNPSTNSGAGSLRKATTDPGPVLPCPPLHKYYMYILRILYV